MEGLTGTDYLLSVPAQGMFHLLLHTPPDTSALLVFHTPPQNWTLMQIQLQLEKELTSPRIQVILLQSTLLQLVLAQSNKCQLLLLLLHMIVQPHYKLTFYSYTSHYILKG